MLKKTCVSCLRSLDIAQFPRGRKKCPQCRTSSLFQLKMERQRNQEFNILMKNWPRVPGSKPRGY